MSLIRYRPVIKNKEADMAVDVSGAWTSLTCYYTLHDKIVTIQAENERLKLKKFTSEELLSIKAEVELLQAQFKRDIYNQALAENERLRKAGDELERVLTNRLGSYEAGNASHEWQSAKGVKS
jgi:hypothetical protein